jgi:hypothetical protein
MPILTICQSCGARVRISERAIGTGRAAQCPKCHLPLTGPAIVPSPARKRRGQTPAPAAPPQPEPVSLVSVGSCASCGAPLSVPPEMLGRWIECGKCGAGFAALAETSPAASPQIATDSDSPAGARGGINCVGLLLALGAVSLLVIALVVGGIMVGARMRSAEPENGPAVPAAPEARKEQLLGRLEELRTRINTLEKRRDELGQEDTDLDARLAISKELKQARDEEEQLLAELEGLAGEPTATGR